jgi:hypothetical protein
MISMPAPAMPANSSAGAANHRMPEGLSIAARGRAPGRRKLPELGLQLGEGDVAGLVAVGVDVDADDAGRNVDGDVAAGVPLDPLLDRLGRRRLSLASGVTPGRWLLLTARKVEHRPSAFGVEPRSEAERLFGLTAAVAPCYRHF